VTNGPSPKTKEALKPETNDQSRDEPPAPAAPPPPSQVAGPEGASLGPSFDIGEFLKIDNIPGFGLEVGNSFLSSCLFFFFFQVLKKE
jgi:hypothetical protein